MAVAYQPKPTPSYDVDLTTPIINLVQKKVIPMNKTVKNTPRPNLWDVLPPPPKGYDSSEFDKLINSTYSSSEPSISTSLSSLVIKPSWIVTSLVHWRAISSS